MSEPRGCPTPGACSAVAEIASLRAQRDELLATLKLAREYVVCGFSISQQIDAAVAAVEDQHGEQIGGGPGG